ACRHFGGRVVGQPRRAWRCRQRNLSHQVPGERPGIDTVAGQCANSISTIETQQPTAAIYGDAWCTPESYRARTNLLHLYLASSRQSNRGIAAFGYSHGLGTGTIKLDFTSAIRASDLICGSSLPC